MIPFHPLADIFPLIEGAEFDDLVADVREHGLRERIVLLDDQILDGRNRYRACVAAGIMREDATQPAAGHLTKYFHFHVPPSQPSPSHDELVAYVISKNLRRRQLNESQRAMVAAKLATMRQGARTDLAPIGAMSDAQAAQALHISERSVERAKAVQRDGTSVLQHAVESGELRISTAALIARLPKEEQVRLLQEAAPQAVKAAAKQINARESAAKRDNARRLHEELSAQSKPLEADRRYPVIYADPATRFESGFSGRSIENHYPTDTIEAWCELPVKDLAWTDCILFVWTTIPHLANTITKLIPAWGFEYKSCLCWDKVIAGTGYWARNQHELLLIATRGHPQLAEPEDRPGSIYTERKGDHSAKPEYYRELIELMTPGQTRIELFARSPREGWVSWGNQAKGKAA